VEERKGTTAGVSKLIDLPSLLPCNEPRSVPFVSKLRDNVLEVISKVS